MNGNEIAGIVPGSYLGLTRAWRAGDRVDLDLDLSPRTWEGERECSGLTSIYRGPLLLAYDPRYNRSVPPPDEPEGPDALPAPRILVPSDAGKPLPWDGHVPPILLVETRTPSGAPVRLCDFASAGATGTAYRSWLPAVLRGQPMT